METTTATDWIEEGVTYAEMESDAFDSGTVTIDTARESSYLIGCLNVFLTSFSLRLA